jgi:pimeloyl-ACP methyl ester carboxylesterase
MDLNISYEEQLTGFLKTHPYKDVVIDGANFHYLHCGKGDKTLIFLVGGMGLSFLYMPYITALESEYRILTFDYPYEYDDNSGLVDSISSLLDHLNITKGVLIGSSYGGYVAQMFARKHPDMTEGLCLFSTASLSEMTVNELMAKYQKKAPLLLWILRHVPYSWLKPVMIRSCMRMAKNTTPEVYSYTKDLFRFIYRDYTRKLDLHMTNLLIDLMNQIPCIPEDFAYLRGRVLLILPENDESFTPEMQKDLIGMMPESVIVEGVDSGHISTLIQVERYVEEIRRFIKTVL